jgi:hypothetical protein
VQRYYVVFPNLRARIGMLQISFENATPRSPRTANILNLRISEVSSAPCHHYESGAGRHQVVRETHPVFCRSLGMRVINVKKHWIDHTKRGTQKVGTQCRRTRTYQPPRRAAHALVGRMKESETAFRETTIPPRCRSPSCRGGCRR